MCVCEVDSYPHVGNGLCRSRCVWPHVASCKVQYGRYVSDCCLVERLRRMGLSIIPFESSRPRSHSGGRGDSLAMQWLFIVPRSPLACQEMVKTGSAGLNPVSVGHFVQSTHGIHLMGRNPRRYRCKAPAY
ncbi:hypothetical protein EJ03DRAFT_76410 [Teratosphaeria nubilosa]|uniref:Uncharacterized protein n=1 Tax=Teratosphaeria nubilosa TaxID=161662 RepID=A0A6G1LC82_9PEZI|nr:hypothetical protein EJ03DRAFT_76410 [Teratosphaeria nubilosa]